MWKPRYEYMWKLYCQVNSCLHHYRENKLTCISTLMKDILVSPCKIKILGTYHHVKWQLNMYDMIEDVLARNCAKFVTSVWGTSSETYQKGNRLTSNAEQQRHRKLPSTVSSNTTGSSLVQPPVSLEKISPTYTRDENFWFILLWEYFWILVLYFLRISSWYMG